jgi:hypothetical protein
MQDSVYRYRFSPSLDLAEVQSTVTLALMATESLHGETRVRLEQRHTFDAAARVCTIDASSEVGSDLNRLFLGFISREFGQDSFDVERIAACERAPAAPAA